MKYSLSLKPVCYLLLPLLALLASSGCGGDEASGSRDKSTRGKSTQDKDKSTQDKSTQDKSTQDKSTQDKSTQDKSTQDKSTQDKSTQDKSSKPEKKIPVTIIGKWKDKNKLSFNEEAAEGTASTSGTITFKEDGIWESKGLVTLNGTLVGIKANNLKFEQESRGSWKKKDEAILRTWTDLTLTPKATSLTALAIQAAAPPLVKGEKEEYEILSLDRERMVLRKTETGNEVTLIRME